MTNDAYVLQPDEGEARWSVEGALTRVLAMGEMTGERLALVEDRGSRGDSTPLHRHEDDEESFYILEGTLSFWLGDEAPIQALPGSFVHIPGGVTHALRVDSETARYLIFTTPQHGAFYLEISDPVVAGEPQPTGEMDMERVELACQRFGVEILGPPPIS
jgi:quercetin dioxygenase-like cupin family protein